MARLIDAILEINPNAEVSILNNNYDKITWHNIEPIDKATLDAKVSEMETNEINEAKAKEDLKLSAKTKLMNGEALTEDEANVMVGL